MSSYELIDLIFSGSSAAAENVAIYISILLAFFLTAYYFGNKLGKVELVLISVVYSVFCFVFIFGTYQLYTQLSVIAQFVSGVDFSIGVYVTLFTMLGSWFLSLLFMFQRSRLE